MNDRIPFMQPFYGPVIPGGGQHPWPTRVVLQYAGHDKTQDLWIVRDQVFTPYGVEPGMGTRYTDPDDAFGAFTEWVLSELQDAAKVLVRGEPIWPEERAP